MWFCWLWQVTVSVSSYNWSNTVFVFLFIMRFSILKTECLCRYRGGHAIRHWKETQHCYSLELETQRVWDYVGDNYVHRLIQSKTDGKLVELNSYCVHANDGCGGCQCVDSGVSEALLKSKADAVIFFSVLLGKGSLKFSLALSSNISSKFITDC